jgi:hypothetical protein
MTEIKLEERIAVALAKLILDPSAPPARHIAVGAASPMPAARTSALSVSLCSRCTGTPLTAGHTPWRPGGSPPWSDPCLRRRCARGGSEPPRLALVGRGPGTRGPARWTSFSQRAPPPRPPRPPSGPPSLPPSLPLFSLPFVSCVPNVRPCHSYHRALLALACSPCLTVRIHFVRSPFCAACW